MYIQFLDGYKNNIDALTCISKNIVKIYKIEQNLSGFQVFTDNGDLLGDYSDFTTLYKHESDGYMLSNDGSVYQETEIGKIPIYIPTLEEVKKSKKAELSFKCKETISKGVDVVFQDRTEHFRLTVEDQLNLMRKKEQLEKGESKTEYHADGMPCRYYSKEDMQKIICAADDFISYQTSYCNGMFQWIDSLSTIDDVEKIHYGVHLPIQFQSEQLKKK